MKKVGYRDYMDQLEDEFSDVNPSSLRRVVRHGLALISLFRRNNQDILLHNNIDKRYVYMGQISSDSDRAALSKKKVRGKIRLVYNLMMKDKPKDEYYYFGLSEENYQLHLVGTAIDKVLIFRIQKEAELYRKGTHFFRIHNPDAVKYCIQMNNYETKDAEYIYQRVANGSNTINDTEQCTH